MQYGIDSTVHHTNTSNPLTALVPANIARLLQERPITMLPVAPTMTQAQLRALFPKGNIYVCDFYVEGIEKGRELPYGFELEGIINIDHHAPVRSMCRTVSSGNLALEFVRYHGPLVGNEQVVIHHLDCDSFVSSLILRGILPPLPKWGEIVIAADHTGAVEPMADLLQALSEYRDMNLSAESVFRLSRGMALDRTAQEALDARARQRMGLQTLVENAALQKVGGVTWLSSEIDVDGELLVSLVPDALVLMSALPSRNKIGTWINRVRLGPSAPQGFSLLDIGIDTFDKNWGGRWNAGSNNRGGGSALAPERYASRLAEVVDGALKRG